MAQARVKAIAQQDREMGSLNNDAVERICAFASSLVDQFRVSTD